MTDSFTLMMVKDNADLLRPLAPSTKLAIKQEIFGPEVATTIEPSSRGTFFDYLEAELAKFGSASRSCKLVSNGDGVRAVEDLVSIVKTLKQERGSSRRQIRSMLQEHFRSGLSLDLSMDLAACLLTMLNIRNEQLRLQTPLTPTIQWDDELTLETLVADQFPIASWSVSSREGRLHPAFTAAAMVRICGLKISWTTCLADHLRLDQEFKILRVFPYKQSLLDHLEGVRKHRQPALVADSVLAETIQSLDLLFPHWDFQTNKLLKEHGQSFHQVGPFPSSRRLNLCDFEHWRDRLAELYEEVYCCPPASWAQLWADRRNPQQWYTFWIALLILLLTIVSTIASIVQAWASVRSLHST